jgi:uncharacterized delta-60 repeat protein
MYLSSKKILATALTLACASTAYAAPIDLDTSFSGDGQRMANYSNATTPSDSFFTDVAATPDDKIIAVGHAKTGDTQYEGIIVKHLIDGSIDSTFATNGVFRHADKADTKFSAVAIQADGKILVAGNNRDDGASYKLVVLRLNSDGTLDTGFANNGVYTVRYPNPMTSPNTRPTHGHLYGRDIAINSKGEILISAGQWTGQMASLNRFVGYVIKLDSHGELDTGFGYDGNTANNGVTRLTYGYGEINNYSVEITKLTLDANDKMYVGGRWSSAASGNPSTMFLQQIAADGKAINQVPSFSNAVYNRWSRVSDPRFGGGNDKQIVNSAVVLPGGDIISAGCDRGQSNSPTRMQRQSNRGSFIAGFGPNGAVLGSYSGVNDCFRDLNYHPTVGIVAVGIAGTAPFITFNHEQLGYEVDTHIFSKTGYFDGVATLSTGQIVAVGNVEHPVSGSRESFISVFEGSALTTASTPTVSLPSFAEQTNVDVNTAMQSSTESLTITPTGSLDAKVIDGSANISDVNHPELSPITVNDGDTVQLRHASSSEAETEMLTTLVIDRDAGFSHNNKSWKPTDIIRSFKTTTAVADRTPDAFSLLRTGTPSAINSVSISATAIISGINAAADVSISTGGGSAGSSSIPVSAGAEYSIHRHGQPRAEDYTSADGTIREDDRITIRHTNSSSYGTATTSTLTVGGITASYVSTTEAIDTTPDAFNVGADFPSRLPDTVQQSISVITVSGINAAAPISIIDGEYSINSAAFTSTPGTVENGDQVRTRLTTSSSFSTTTTMTLNIGGITDSLTSTTVAKDVTPDAFHVGSDFSSRLPNTVLQSISVITVSGINAATPISIANGEYSINSAAFTSAPGTVENGDQVRTRHTTSSSFSTTTTMTLNIGGITDSLSSTTAAKDVTPSAFSFPNQTNVAMESLIISAPITVSGINFNALASIANGEMSINGGAYRSSNVNINNGDSITIRHTSSSVELDNMTSTLTLGSVMGTFTSVTSPAVVVVPSDTIPDAFSFASLTDVALSSVVSSDTVSITGIDTATPISVTGGEYSLNGASFTSAAGTVNNGDTVIVRHTSSAASSSNTSSALTVGGVTGTFISVTMPPVVVVPSDTTPDAYSFTSKTSVALSAVTLSNSVTIAGIDTATTISVTNGEYSLNGGSFTSAAGTLTNGTEVTVRHTTPENYSANTTTQLNIGGVTSNFKTTTIVANTTGSPANPSDPSAGSSGGSGGSMNFLYLLAAGLFFGRKRKS